MSERIVVCPVGKLFAEMLLFDGQRSHPADLVELASYGFFGFRRIEPKYYKSPDQLSRVGHERFNVYGRALCEILQKMDGRLCRGTAHQRSVLALQVSLCR